MPTSRILLLPLCVAFLFACNPSSDAGTDAAAIDSGADAVAACSAPTSGPTMHVAETISADETWSAAASPHIITGDITVAPMITLTIEPCATVQVAPDHYIYVHGAIVSKGTATQPITIGQQTSGMRWTTLEIDDPGTGDFEYTTISGGGGLVTSTSGTTLHIRGTTATGPEKILKVDHLTITDSAGYGVLMTELSAFMDGSQALTITKSGIEDTNHPFPMSVNLQALSSLPTGAYTGNGDDEVQIRGDSPRSSLDVDATMHDLGVPYHVGGGGANTTFDVANDSGLATLTIEPNVTIRFEQNGSFIVGHYSNDDPPKGAVIALGTQSQPITFTSGLASPAPGDWMGLLYTNTISAADRLDYVNIDYAGGSCACVVGCIPQNMNSNAAIIFFNQPPDGMITNTSISHSAMHGIDRAWEGTSDPSFLSNVTFADIAGCHETVPRDQNNACPSMIPCP